MGSYDAGATCTPSRRRTAGPGGRASWWTSRRCAKRAPSAESERRRRAAPPHLIADLEHMCRKTTIKSTTSLTMLAIVQVDGWERGAVILGACDEDGVLDAMRVRFADGVEDDWPIADFRWPVNRCRLTIGCEVIITRPCIFSIQTH